MPNWLNRFFRMGDAPLANRERRYWSIGEVSAYQRAYWSAAAQVMADHYTAVEKIIFKDTNKDTLRPDLPSQAVLELRARSAVAIVCRYVNMEMHAQRESYSSWFDAAHPTAWSTNDVPFSTAPGPMIWDVEPDAKALVQRLRTATLQSLRDSADEPLRQVLEQLSFREQQITALWTYLTVSDETMLQREFARAQQRLLDRAKNRQEDQHVGDRGTLPADTAKLRAGELSWSSPAQVPVSTPQSPQPPKSPDGESLMDGSPDPAAVFVVHGRNERLRNDFFSFLRAIGLRPIEWSEALTMTGQATPYIGAVLDEAFRRAKAVVVLLTPDDEVRLREDLWHPGEASLEREAHFQARPNVLFEAGMAFATHPSQTLLIEIGKVKPFSDVAGRHIVRLDDSPDRRLDVAERLRQVGCSVSTSGRDWLKTGRFSSV